MTATMSPRTALAAAALVVSMMTGVYGYCEEGEIAQVHLDHEFHGKWYRKDSLPSLENSSQILLPCALVICRGRLSLSARTLFY